MNTPNHDDHRVEELLAQALRDEARSVRPDPDGLRKIQARTESPSAPRWRAWALTAGAGVAAAAVITAVVLVTDGEDTGNPPIAGTPSGSQAPSTGETPPTGDDRQPVSPTHDPVYNPDGTNVTLHYVGTLMFVGETGERRGAAYLFTEPHTLADTSRLGAVREFLTGTPYDDDYVSGWPEGVDVSGIETDGSGTTIDLGGDADVEAAPDVPVPDVTNAAEVRQRVAELAIQGIIRTAGIADGPVRFTFNGEPVGLLLGQDVSGGVEVQDDSSADFTLTRSPVQVTSPVEGQALPSPVVVTGDGNVFEGTVNWELLDADGDVVDDGFVTTAFMEWAPFEVDLGDLDPGTYTFRALEYSAANGEPIHYDDKTFTVFR